MQIKFIKITQLYIQVQEKVLHLPNIVQGAHENSEMPLQDVIKTQQISD